MNKLKATDGCINKVLLKHTNISSAIAIELSISTTSFHDLPTCLCQSLFILPGDMTQWQSICLAYTMSEEKRLLSLPQMEKKTLNSHSVLDF